ncbi:hypothetical protein HWD08_gp133 [Salmonella phage L6jm]|uniref:Uncharacterized protein n=1 Tax=Salmonella phage L6jm TaxID=2713222 RepID=A0A6G6XQY5_9CAUD|nr:hypothetical protein HWD08_gp133 [Salmonella phage L6jm]QIG61244.1 hypothetical protein [Salmonella phage L6jm]
MKDITLKFKDKNEYKNFLVGISWEENEELRDKFLLDEIGYTYTEIPSLGDEEPTYIRNEGYYVNVRILDESFTYSYFEPFIVQLEQPLREWA